MEELPRQIKIRNVVENRQEGIIILEDIHDPHNAEAVVRSADAFGFQKVYLIFEQEAYFNPKSIGKSSSKGTNKWIDFKTFRSTEECLLEVKKEGYEIWATILDKEANSIYESSFLNKKVAVVLGNEHRGISQKVIELADKKLYIPMKGMVQSFNLSVSASLVMYEISRQRHKAGTNKYTLSDEEQASLVERFSLKR